VSHPQLTLLTGELQTLFSPAMATDPVIRESQGYIAKSKWRGAQPPPALRELMDPEFLNDVWQQLDALLLQPAQTSRLRCGADAVQVLGSAVFLLSASGQIHTFLWSQTNELEWTPSRFVIVTEIPFGKIWLKRLVSKALQVQCQYLKRYHLMDTEITAAHVDWLLLALGRQVHKAHDMRLVRQRISHALRLSKDAWRLCHHTHMASPIESKSSFRQYNLCVRHKVELLEIEADASGALGVYAALCEGLDFPQVGEPTQRLKQYFKQRCLSSRVWRLVICSGARLLPLVRQFYSANADSAVIDCLRVMDGLGVVRTPPVWLSQALFAEWGNAGARRLSYQSLMMPAMSNLRHLTALALALAKFGHPDPAQEQQVNAVVHWLTEPTTRALTRSQRQGGWDYLVREANHFQRQREEEARAKSVAWGVPFEGIQVGTLQLVSLANSVQLIEEGRRMRNCAAGWAPRCATGNELLVSVRDQSSQRVATASFQWEEGKWHFGDAKGPMNRILSERLMQRLRRSAGLLPCPVILESPEPQELQEEKPSESLDEMLKRACAA
jgi:hypothetical protein